MKGIRAGTLLVALVVVICLLAAFPVYSQDKAEPAAPALGENKGIEPKADKLLKQMSDYLAGLKQFSVDTDSSQEIVLKTGQKVQYYSEGSVYVQRPDKLRADRKGQFVDLSLYYDGKNVTVYGKRRNMYASSEAPPNLDKALDYARDELGLIAPGADLLYSNVYDELIKGIETGFFVGENDIQGKKCNHLAFRTKALDWQIWIDDGEKPLPRRFVITTTSAAGMPEYQINFHGWKTDGSIANDTFTFVPPKDAQKIDFLKKATTAPSAPEGGKEK